MLAGVLVCQTGHAPPQGMLHLGLFSVIHYGMQYTRYYLQHLLPELVLDWGNIKSLNCGRTRKEYAYLSG